YIVRDGENLDKIKEKGDACIFVGYSTWSRAYRVFNKRTRVIVETIHVNIDELPQMALDHGNDLLTGSRGIDLYSITLQDTTSPNPICLMAKATSSQVWLWHRRLSYLNFDTINLLSKNDIVIGLPKLKFVKNHLLFFLYVGESQTEVFSNKDYPKLQKTGTTSTHGFMWSHARTPEQNGVVERRNRTLVEAA
nr:integrase, catalytic region, zinc finger, CCHC-type, peptidase aspartic, catalytic [Tanacetum cinerariifolium]